MYFVLIKFIPKFIHFIIHYDVLLCGLRSLFSSLRSLIYAFAICTRTLLNILMPSSRLTWSFCSRIAFIIYFLRWSCTMRLKLRPLLPNLPFDISLKNWFILAVFSFISEPFEESFISIILRNSLNSMQPEPSSSTQSIISSTSSRVSAKPRPISGSSSSSIPMEPEPSSSRALKHSCSFFISSSVNLRTWPYPRWQYHFLCFFSSN